MSFQDIPTFQRLPDYLKTYVVDQDYSSYTPREQATWRFIMRNSRPWFMKHAHSVYMEGLAKTGIPISRIPDVREMDRVLSEFGWGALCVRGFIPPLAFLEFQSLKILPIAADMRSVDHIAYTPAPDIVHEAAGHAPILADPHYTRYLEKYARLARKAVFSGQDIKLYEAIRVLSDVKENPDSSPEAVASAEECLTKAAEAVTWVSEAAQVARMNWWTAEYGLVGECENPRIYGAGLLSSLGESRTCLEEGVKKIPLTLGCIRQSYDITRPQPQLFVAKNFEHLVDVLEELEDTMSFRKGGREALETGKKAAAVTTTVFSSGVSVSGVLSDIRDSLLDEPGFLRWSGPVQLAFEDQQIPGHGRERHPEGFSSPLGSWEGFPEKSPCSLTEAELSEGGIRKGERCVLKFKAGYKVQGIVRDFLFHGGKLCLIIWAQCHVSKGAETLFDPEWGEFDMLVASGHASSVYGGPADWGRYGSYDFGKASTIPGRTSPFTEDEKRLFELYEEVSLLRREEVTDRLVLEDNLQQVAGKLEKDFPGEWLLGLEIIELVRQKLGAGESSYGWAQSLCDNVLNRTVLRHDVAGFVEAGLSIAGEPD